jgi:23S rRNA pseudouridine1911/1915/1917 synthase
VTAEATPLSVLYEDEYLLAVDKPAGVVSHPTYKHDAGTVLNALVWRARTWPAPQRPSLVGRLDKLTSGVVLVAKTAAVHAALQRVMISASGEKDYLAVVYGRVNRIRGRIALRLGRNREDLRKVAASQTTGAESVTLFERFGRVAAPHVGLSLLRCRLVTGRKHQIRAHLAASGWPIVGDPAYGESRAAAIADPALAAVVQAFPRQALHAWRVAFVHPITSERLCIEAPLPRDLEGLLRASGLPLPA